MTKEELRAKYARVPTDFSEIAMLKDQLIESGLLDVAQINPENAGKAIVFDENGTLTVVDMPESLTQEQVQEMINASIGDALTANY